MCIYANYFKQNITATMNKTFIFIFILSICHSSHCKAVEGQHERCVGILLENHSEPNLVDINGNTALHLAANIPSVSTARLLLEHEANINAPNKVYSGETLMVL